MQKAQAHRGNTSVLLLCPMDQSSSFHSLLTLSLPPTHNLSFHMCGCVYRGIAENCHWEDTTKIGAPQPFATVNEVDDVRSRLDYLESIVSRIPQNLLEAGPDTVSAQP